MSEPRPPEGAEGRRPEMGEDRRPELSGDGYPEQRSDAGSGPERREAESATPPAARPPVPTTRSPYPDDLYCPGCGYSLRGLTSDRCPECGLRLDFIESDTPLIPWERRRELGRLRAYWQTVFQVMFRSKVFCRAVYRPVSYRDAQLFRWITILHVYLPALLALPVVHWLYPDLLPLAAGETGWWFLVLVGVCVLLALPALTGLPSYLFHPRYLPLAQQNRAVALSYYGGAALALMPVVLVTVCATLTADTARDEFALLMATLALLLLGAVAVLWIGLFAIARRIVRRTIAALGLLPLVAVGVYGALVAGQSRGELDVMLGPLAVVLGLGLALLYWLDLIAIARHTLRRSLATLRVAVLVPVLWCVGGLLILVGLPFVAYFVALVFYSLRGGGLSG